MNFVYREYQGEAHPATRDLCKTLNQTGVKSQIIQRGAIESIFYGTESRTIFVSLIQNNPRPRS